MLQRRIASKMLKCSPQRVWLSPDHSKEIKEAITRSDVRILVSRGIIQKIALTGNSNGRRKDTLKQLRKGRSRGAGSRKGKANARSNIKDSWVTRVRLQRALLQRMRESKIISEENFKILYARVKGGFFRSIRHIKLFCEEQGFINKEAAQKSKTVTHAKNAEKKQHNKTDGSE